MEEEIEKIRKDAEAVDARQDEELRRAREEAEVPEDEEKLTQEMLHERTVEMLALDSLLYERGLLRFRELELQTITPGMVVCSRKERWEYIFGDDDRLFDCVQQLGYDTREAAAEAVVDLYDCLSNDRPVDSVEEVLERYKEKALVFGPPLTLRQAQLLVCVGKSIGLKCTVGGFDQ